ncbi:hypothetical protein AGMMS50293_13620 [Spirochaetia bacterium]|nr:hypothetical protein AGMMS50293_13620 [Spirochaetia bacterium]
MLIMLMTFGIVVLSCDNDTTSNGNTYTVSIAVADGSGGMGSVSITNGSPTGTYTLEGNYGLIHSDGFNADIGMFALTSATELTMYLVAPNPVTGTFHGVKQNE